MSVDYFVFLGPYLCIKKKEVTVMVERNCCNNSQCAEWKKRQWDERKFCSSCGEPIKMGIYPATQDRFQRDQVLTGEYEESFSSYEYDGGDDEHLYLFPNKGNKGGRRFSYNVCRDNVELQIRNLDQEAEISLFEAEYSREMMLIKRIVGYDFEVRWGLINYAH